MSASLLESVWGAGKVAEMNPEGESHSVLTMLMQLEGSKFWENMLTGRYIFFC